MEETLCTKHNSPIQLCKTRDVVSIAFTTDPVINHQLSNGSTAADCTQQPLSAVLQDVIMSSQRSPSLTQPSLKKQQSISSFFTPKVTSSQQHAPSQSNRNSLNERENIRPEANADTGSPKFVDNARGNQLLSSKRSTVASRDSGEIDSNVLPRVKRRKPNDVRSDDENETLMRDPVLLPRNSSDKAVKTTERTSKYLFSSPLAPTQNGSDEDAESDETRRVKAQLHRRFVKKLGRPDSIAEIKRRNHVLQEESQDGEDGAEDEEEDEAQEQTKATTKTGGRRPAAAKKGRDKLTPMERQVIDIKRKHMDTVLVVEVGYKFRFFGEDARVAARELNIVCIPGKFRFDEHPSEAHLDRFASASIPVHRLHVHVRRLVSAGHKVGVVRQLETAALKKAGDNRNSTFERGLTNLYTKGTYIDDHEGLDAQLAFSDEGAPATGHLLCLTETTSKGYGSDEKVQIGLVAVQPSTGDIIYDDFEDGWMRSELETRLLHIAPCEFLIVGNVSKETDKVVEHLSGSKANVFGDKARVERVDKPKTMAAKAYDHITKFYGDKTSSDATSSSQVQSSQETGTLLDKIHKLSENATVCLSAMITHLTDYGLQHVFDLTKYFQSFSARSHMLLNGNTLTSLEIYRNATDHTERGSLFWALDRTETRFGQRLLRKWVGRPLLDRVRLDQRVAAVQELHENQSTAAVDRIKRLLRTTKGDLEKSLIRIYYQRCTRSELLGTLQSLQSIAQEYAHVESPGDTGFKSDLISEAIVSLPKIQANVIQYLERINLEAAKENDKYSFFRSEHETEDIIDHKVGITAIEHDLKEFKAEAAAKLRKTRVEYVTVAGIDYLIEVENDQLKNVPASWIKISGTKKVSRYHTPEVVRFIRERDQHKEALANACDVAFKDMLIEIGSHYQIFRDCVQSLALLDCLLSLAEVASQPGYCQPEFSDDIGIDIEAGRHPMVEQILTDPFVPNNIHMSSRERAMLVTGPNMGGKSSFVRSVALISIMAQIGSFVPATSARIGLFDAVFTRMGAFDNMMKGESTFMVELSETSDILKQASPRSLIILDELGRGTSTHDGVAIAQAVLQYIVTVPQSLTLFITHYQTLARLAEGFPDGELRNVHMKFTEQEGDSDEKDVTFLYEVEPGIAHRSYGLNVAKLAGLPKTVIEEARQQSAQMERKEQAKRLAYLSKIAGSLLSSASSDVLEHFVAGVDQLAMK